MPTATLAAVLAFASLTEPLVNLATSAIGSLGLAGVVLLMAITGVIAVPGTEPTMLFAGFDAYRGTLSLPAVIIAGVVGDVLGATIAYTIGYYGREGVLERQGSKLHVSQRRLQRANRWFARYGSPAMLVSRAVPIVRAAFPYAAGIAEMPFKRFALFTTLGSIAWVSGLAILGREVGRNWQSWRHHLQYVDYVGAAVVVAAIVYLIFRVRRDRGMRRDPAVDALPE